MDAIQLRKPALATFDIEAPLGLGGPSPGRLYLLSTRAGCERLWQAPGQGAARQPLPKVSLIQTADVWFPPACIWATYVG
jgi:hypothetical protein